MKRKTGTTDALICTNTCATGSPAFLAGTNISQILKHSLRFNCIDSASSQALLSQSSLSALVSSCSGPVKALDSLHSQEVALSPYPSPLHHNATAMAANSAPGCRALFVKGLAKNCSERHLSTLFSAFGACHCQVSVPQIDSVHTCNRAGCLALQLSCAV